MTKPTNFALFALTALAGACGRDSEREPATARDTDRNVYSDRLTPASRARTAAEQLSYARCEREQQCGNIGPDKTFSSSRDCFARIQSDWKDDLSSRECPGGINQVELNECMAEIRSEDCNNPFDTLARISECTQGQICIEEP